MADFRKWLFAIAVVALLAGFSVPVRAQQGPAFNCQATVGVPPLIRGEGFTELVGDVTLDCTGGTPTPAGTAVPPVDITVFLSQNVTSKITASHGGVNYDEALLIVDEPHSASHPTTPLLNCGNVVAPDTGNSGPGVCSIISDGNPVDTYDGLATTSCSEGQSYGCGHPNVFQGRQGSPFFASGFPQSSVTFAGVPIDPPGSVGHRILRITNIRVNATGQLASNGLFLSPITLQISINGNTSMGVNNPTQTVAYVQPGLGCPEQGSNCGTNGSGTNFLQCISQTGAETNASITFQEGFLSSWKARNISFITAQGDDILSGGGDGNGQLQPSASYWSYNGSFNTPNDVNQNVPGAIYNTESGFMFPSASTGVNVPKDFDPDPNPPQGVGTVPITEISTGVSANSFYNAYNGSSNTNISAAGTVDQGTRLVMSLNMHSIQNVQVSVPAQVVLRNTAGHASGAMILIDNTNSSGYGGTFDTGTGNVAVTNNSLIVYEIVFADPFSLETASVPFFVTFNNNPTTLPTTGVTAQVTGAGFAPFYSPSQANQATTDPTPLPIPRFNAGSTSTINLFTINKCTCNILFPFVTSGGAANFDTGIAIANTSKDPGAVAFGAGNGAGPQTGTVTLWMFGSNAAGLDASALPAQTTTVPVPAGQTLLYTFSAGGGQVGAGTGANLVSAGLNNQWAGYTGYVIAQAQFQYCHAFAFISQVGLAAGVSDGYLGLILDNNGVNCEGGQQGTPGAGGGTMNLGLCRTNQEGENLVH